MSTYVCHSIRLLYAIRYLHCSRMAYAVREKEVVYAIHPEQRLQAKKEEYRIAK